MGADGDRPPSEGPSRAGLARGDRRARKLGALGGIVSLEAPLNSGNGVIGGIAAPLGSFSVWCLAQDRAAQAAPAE
jgi:hypothetical protein